VNYLSQKKIITDDFAGIICNTNVLDAYLTGFERNFGPEKPCKYSIDF
jgi:hypothetical protein